MPHTDRTAKTSRLPWRTVGFLMILLALVVAVSGAVVAIRQAATHTARLLAQAELRAGDLARAAQVLSQREITAAHETILTVWHAGADDEPWPGSSLPNWIDGVYVWEEGKLTALQQPVRARLPIEEFLVRKLSAVSMDRSSGDKSGGVRFLSPDCGVESPILACYRVVGERGSRAALVVVLETQRALGHLIEPWLPPDLLLELVRGSSARASWSQPLAGVFQCWSFQPTAAFIQEQRRATRGQTGAYLGMLMLALVTLLAAMWFLVRVVRREVALVKLKANFVADVSHELKTPLAVIRLLSETLQAGRVSSEEKRNEYFSIIMREITRLTNLINNILDFARIEAQRRDYDLKPMDVGQVVREAYEAYRPELDHHGFEHVLTIPETLPRVDADADALSQVMLNLMSNAVKYSREERYLAVEVTNDTRRNRRGVLISIHDRGIGVQAEDRAYLFEGFFRASDERVRDQRGTGLGLALVKHIIDAHHGFVDVESRLVRGSTFRIFLPATEREPAAPQGSPSSSDARGDESSSA